MNNDLISREYMKKAIEQFFVREKYYHPHSKGRKTIPTEEVIDIIDNAPTVEPETKVVANVTFDKEQMEELVEKAKADILAQIERPIGKWKVFMVGREGEKIINITYHCSECGRSIVYIPNSVDPDETTFLAKYPFCHCGADMRGGAE